MPGTVLGHCLRIKMLIYLIALIRAMNSFLQCFQFLLISKFLWNWELSSSYIWKLVLCSFFLSTISWKKNTLHGKRSVNNQKDYGTLSHHSDTFLPPAPMRKKWSLAQELRESQPLNTGSGGPRVHQSRLKEMEAAPLIEWAQIVWISL